VNLVSSSKSCVSWNLF